jgi:hypothetical protein
VKDGGMKYIAFAILTTGELGCVSGLLWYWIAYKYMVGTGSMMNIVLYCI